jgi:membrane protein YqaA with SNARE-associated domain
MRLAARPHASSALGVISFAESSFFPIPPDVLLIPMVIADRVKAWRFAGICTIASVLGALAGYVIGAVLFDFIAQPILSFYGYMEKFEAFAETYKQWGVWIVLLGGLTPIPFKVITIASGAAGLDVFTFLLFSLLARGSRFFAVAGLLYLYGVPIRTFIEERLALVFTCGLAALIGGFLLLKVLL